MSEIMDRILSGESADEVLSEERGKGMGVGGPRQGDGGTDTCVCPECGAKVPHKRGTPCAGMTCPECGAKMQGEGAPQEEIDYVGRLLAGDSVDEVFGEAEIAGAKSRGFEVVVQAENTQEASAILKAFKSAGLPFEVDKAFSKVVALVEACSSSAAINEIYSILQEAGILPEDGCESPVVAESSGKVTAVEKKGAVETSYVQYIKRKNSYEPAGPIKLVEELEPALYEVRAGFSGPVFEKVKPRTDHLLVFENSVMKSVMEEVDKFWGLKGNFEKLGFLHNRGILLYGPPGTGKTALIHQISEQMVDRDDTVIFGKSIHLVTEALHVFRQIEPERKMLVVLEDMDEYIGYSERDTLQLLDGSNSVDNVLFLGTTNYIERFPERLTRPGRFDKLVEIGMPPKAGRVAYLNDKLTGIVDEDEIEAIAEKTDGFSFGHLR